ncbi:MAG TPA: heavy-metal-associated domain-containing protein [Firmicutes bacterium]|nr:heavy-metal-associated domain-containing protein [Bacillota bacterium]
MKRVIEVEGMCCKRCAERAERKLCLLDGVTGAKANFKKGIIFVETTLPDEALAACVTSAGFTVKAIRERRGIFS